MLGNAVDREKELQIKLGKYRNYVSVKLQQNTNIPPNL